VRTVIFFFRNIIFLSCVLLSLIILDSFLGKVNAESSTMIINEVMYDPAGTDTGYEWLELYNLSNSQIDLTGWLVQVAGTTFKTNATLSGSIQPQSIFLVCEPNVADCDLTVPKLAFQNGGGTTDGIQILNADNEIIDAVFYDLPNSNLLVDENGVVVQDERTAETAGSGESIGRVSQLDTDHYADNFTKFGTPTPGQLNLTQSEEEDDGELEGTGSNPFTAILAFLIFPLAGYSARLIRYYKFSRHTNGRQI
jgi:hypothetical protein